MPLQDTGGLLTPFLSEVFASTSANLLSLFCSLDWLHCMLKESSAFLDLSPLLPTRLTWSAWSPSSGQLCTSLISHGAEAVHLEICIICRCKLWRGSASLHEVFSFANCSASHFPAPHTRQFRKKFHIVRWCLLENRYWCFPTIPSPATHVSARLTPLFLQYFITDVALNVRGSKIHPCFVVGSWSSHLIPVLDSYSSITYYVPGMLPEAGTAAVNF